MESEKRELRLTFGEQSQQADKSKSEEFNALLNNRTDQHNLEISKLEQGLYDANAKLAETHELHKITLAEKYSCESKIAQVESHLQAREEYLAATKR